MAGLRRAGRCAACKRHRNRVPMAMAVRSVDVGAVAGSIGGTGGASGGSSAGAAPTAGTAGIVTRLPGAGSYRSIGAPNAAHETDAATTNKPRSSAFMANPQCGEPSKTAISRPVRTVGIGGLLSRGEPRKSLRIHRSHGGTRLNDGNDRERSGTEELVDLPGNFPKCVAA